MPHRFFVTPDAIRKGTVSFTGAQAHQMRDVLRMAAGSELVALDGAGNEYRVALDTLTRDTASGTILSQRAATGEPQTQIVLYQALLKADKMEWVLQKGTEVGISGFVPMVTERSVNDVGKNKFARWTHILTEAAEQAGRGKIPALAEHQSLDAAAKMAAEQGGLLLVPWEQEMTRDLAGALAESLPAENAALHIHLFIGPEGGFSERDIEVLRGYGAMPITLGPRILRGETAGLVAASAILYAMGEMRRG